jgi:hypothetical protein
MKLALMRTATGQEDPELPLLQRISSLELPASEIGNYCTSNYSTKNVFRVQVTDISQHQLFRGDYLNQAFMVKCLQRNHY